MVAWDLDWGKCRDFDLPATNWFRLAYVDYVGPATSCRPVGSNQSTERASSRSGNMSVG